jgi:hypothetical protein
MDYSDYSKKYDNVVEIFLADGDKDEYYTTIKNLEEAIGYFETIEKTEEIQTRLLQARTHLYDAICRQIAKETNHINETNALAQKEYYRRKIQDLEQKLQKKFPEIPVCEFDQGSSSDSPETPNRLVKGGYIVMSLVSACTLALIIGWIIGQMELVLVFFLIMCFLVICEIIAFVLGGLVKREIHCPIVDLIKAVISLKK